MRNCTLYRERKDQRCPMETSDAPWRIEDIEFIPSFSVGSCRRRIGWVEEIWSTETIQERDFSVAAQRHYLTTSHQPLSVRQLQHYRLSSDVEVAILTTILLWGIISKKSQSTEISTARDDASIWKRFSRPDFDSCDCLFFAVHLCLSEADKLA